MAYEFRPSKDEVIGKLVLIALAGTTGAGKTESAMRIARGIVGPNGKFAVIDTENRRALNKKSRYQFDHLDLNAPYSPDNFKGAIEAAEKAGYKAIVVDNFSHEWFGEGGCSDMQEVALEKLAKGDMGKAMQLTALAWKSPKQSHKKLIYRVLQCAVPIIFCLRAEPKIKFTKDANGKMQVIDAGWQPICEKMFGYEMLIYALLMPDKPGVPVHLKKLEPELEPVFKEGKQIDESVGELLAEWAAGGTKQTQGAVATPPQHLKGEARLNPDRESQFPSDIPTPEEEQKALKEAGMIPGEGQPLVAYITKYKEDLEKCATKKEIGKLFKDFVAKNHPKEIIEQATELANEAHKKAA